MTGEKQAFGDLLTLLAFLLEQVVVAEEATELAILAAWLQTQIANRRSQTEVEF